MQPLAILNKFFGHPKFRGQQLDVIERVMAGGHSLVIMPTGMGKSLCFQIPALMFSQQTDGKSDRPGLTLVMSPLMLEVLPT